MKTERQAMLEMESTVLQKYQYLLPLIISIIVLVITGVFEEALTATGFLPPKDEGTLTNWLNSLADLLRRFSKNAVEVWLTIKGRDFGAILSFLNKTIDLQINMYELQLFLFQGKLSYG